MANKKAEMAIKEREVALNKAVQLQKEVKRPENKRCTFWGIKADGHKHSLHFSNPNAPPLVGAALRRSSVARAAKDRGLAQLAPRCTQDPRLDSEEGHPRDREGERQCLKLDIWTNAIFCYRLCGRRASSTCGCRTTVCWRTFSSTRTASSRTSTSGPWDSTCSPCTANSLSPSRKMWRGRL